MEVHRGIQKLDPEEGPRETIPSTIALIQPYGREEFRVKDVSPFSQEYGNSTGRELSQDVTAPGPVLHVGQSCDTACQIHISPTGFSTCEGAGEQRQSLVGKEDWNPGDTSGVQMKESGMERGSKGGEEDRENQRRVGTGAGKQEK
ncbi:hypothetical protein TURU_069745 [Turdus rufiventris]|nr:hypothetical protein TURU_069745 [Turdus rufiventris]